MWPFKKRAKDRGSIWNVKSPLQSGPGYTAFELLREPGSKIVTAFPPECLKLVSDTARAHLDEAMRKEGYRLVG